MRNTDEYTRMMKTSDCGIYGDTTEDTAWFGVLMIPEQLLCYYVTGDWEMFRILRLQASTF